MNLDEETLMARLIRATERLSSVVGVTKIFSLCLNQSRRLGDIFQGKDWGAGFCTMRFKPAVFSTTHKHLVFYPACIQTGLYPTSMEVESIKSLGPVGDLIVAMV